MSTGTLFPEIRKRFFDSNGEPLAGGKVYTYIAGTTTPLSTYTSSTLLAQNTNPITLDANGYCDMWLSNGVYKIVLKDSLLNTLWTIDNVTATSALTGDFTLDKQTGDGTTLTMTLSVTPSSINNTQINIDGVWQQKATYSLSGAVITFSEAPPSGALIECISGRTVDLGTLLSGSATSIQPYVADGGGAGSFRTLFGIIKDDTNFTPFTIANNQSAAADVTGLIFAGATYRTIFIFYQVYRNTTAAGATERVQSGKLSLNYLTVAATWQLTETDRLGEAGVEFTVTNAGQVQYTSDNQGGTAATSQLKALVNAIGA